MTLTNLKPWIEAARRGQFAVGAFNANMLEQFQAIVLAAEAERAPVILQISHHALQYLGSGSVTLGLRYTAAIGRLAAESVSVPVALHLDHAIEDEVSQAIDLGFTSVMFDGGELTFAENMRVTRRLTEIAHAANVFIEAEVGAVPRPNSAGQVEQMGDYTQPETAAEFVAATGIDALAIAIGSIHSVKDKHVELDLERLEAIHAAVAIPLVLHGSSGVTDDHIARGIELGLCKVNVSTQLNKAFTQAARASLARDTEIVDPRKYLGPGRDAMIEAVRERLRFFGTAGRA